MSVYTTIEKDTLVQFLDDYDVGALSAYRGIGEGIENTNYFVDAERGRYVLTLFEEMTADELPDYLELMTHIAEQGVLCPSPIADHNGAFLKELAGKPAALINCLAGGTVRTSNAAQCREVGKSLAGMHLAGASFAKSLPDKRGFDWCLAQRETIQAAVSDDDYKLLASELAHQSECHFDPLPQGIIHADLFRDNVLFEGDTLSGIIDFYYASYGIFLYDLAITINDWCRAEDQTIDIEKYQALVNAYTGLRAINEDEVGAWQDVMRKAALRFWVSRLCDAISPRAGEIIHTKDPDVFKRILLDCRQAVPDLPCG